MTRDRNLPIFTANKTITNLTQYEISQKEPDLPKAALYSQSNQIKFENPKSSLPLKRFIVHFLTTLKPRKTKSQIKAHLSYLDSPYFYIYKPFPRILRQHRVLRNLGKNEITFITKPDK